MKKRLISQVLCLALAAGFMATGAGAMADKDTVISIDNIYKIVMRENHNIAIIDNSIYLTATSTLNTPETVGTSAANTINMSATKKQIAYGAEQLLLNYYKLQNTLGTMRGQLSDLKNTLNVSKVMYDCGMVSKLEYDAISNAYSELSAGIATMENSIAQLRGNLNIMVSNSFDDPINIAEFELMDLLVVNTLDRDALYKAAMLKSTDINASFQTLDSAALMNDILDIEATRKGRNTAYLSYVNSQRTADMSFTSKWDALIAKRDAAALASSKLETDLLSHELDKTRYALGMISKNDFEASKTSYNNAVLSHNTAHVEFCAAYRDLSAFCDGIALS